MIIRKLFKFEGAHIVRDCSSDRCKKSLHGHSYVVEVKLESQFIDNGQMVVDFGLLKNTIKDAIDSFDHAYSLWVKEKDDFKDFITSHSARYIIMPCSPTAEMYSVMFFAIIQNIINKTLFRNGETGVKLHSIRVHETDTGWAEAFYQDYLINWVQRGFTMSDIIFSDEVKREWRDPEMWDKILDNTNHKPFTNPLVERLYE